MSALRRCRIEPLFLFASVAALLAASRVVLLAYLDVTSIPSVNSLYLSPAYPALLLFGATATLALAHQIIDRVRSWEFTRSQLKRFIVAVGLKGRGD